MWAALIDQAHASGSLGFKAATSVCGGYALLRHGELADAEASLRDGIEELILGGCDQRPRGDRGLAGRGRARARGPRRRAARAGGGERARRRLAGRALLARQPRRAAARRGALRARRWPSLATPRSASPAMHAIDTPARSHQALALHHLGRGDEALAVAAEELELARRWGAPVDRGAGAACPRHRRARDGLEHLREAAELAARSPARLELAKALVAEGAALRAARRPTEARDPLRQALELADALGADALAARARHELYAAGGRPRTTALQGPTRSRRPSGASPNAPPPARPTARSPRRCSSRPRPSSCTCATPTASSARATATISPRCCSPRRLDRQTLAPA